MKELRVKDFNRRKERKFVKFFIPLLRGYRDIAFIFPKIIKIYHAFRQIQWYNISTICITIYRYNTLIGRTKEPNTRVMKKKSCRADKTDCSTNLLKLPIFHFYLFPFFKLIAHVKRAL